MTSVECGYCGEPFRQGRLSCPHCGSDSRTGWKGADEIEAESVELGGMDDDAYSDFLEREGLSDSVTPRGHLARNLIALALAALLAWITLR